MPRRKQHAPQRMKCESPVAGLCHVDGDGGTRLEVVDRAERMIDRPIEERAKQLSKLSDRSAVATMCTKKGEIVLSASNEIIRE